MATKRRDPPPPEMLLARQVWGQALQDELDHAKMSRETLGVLVGYNHPKSADQLVTGQNGCSLPVYERVLEIFPALRSVEAPPISVRGRGRGSPGPHKPHDYPEGTVCRPPIRGRKPPKFGGGERLRVDTFLLVWQVDRAMQKPRKQTQFERAKDALGKIWAPILAAIPELDAAVDMAQNLPPEGVSDGSISEEVWRSLKDASMNLSRFKVAVEMATAANKVAERFPCAGGCKVPVAVKGATCASCWTSLLCSGVRLYGCSNRVSDPFDFCSDCEAKHKRQRDKATVRS